MVIQQIFEQSFVEGAPDACWPWLGFIDDQGYGRYSGKRAHRIAYELYVGPIPEEFPVDHECHNRDLECLGGKSCLHRRCVNWHHLQPKTHLDNIQARWDRDLGDTFPCSHPRAVENMDSAGRCKICRHAYGRKYREQHNKRQ